MKKETTNSELLGFMKGQFENTEKRFDGIDKSMKEGFEEVNARIQGNANRIDALADQVRIREDILQRITVLETKVG